MTHTDTTVQLVEDRTADLCVLAVQAYHWYELGHKRGHFASVWQRSLYNVDGLKAQPWWTAKETGYTDLVKVRCPHRKLVFPVTGCKSELCASSDVGEELEDHPGRGSGCDGPEHRDVPPRGGEPERERRVGPVHSVAAGCVLRDQPVVCLLSLSDADC